MYVLGYLFIFIYIYVCVCVCVCVCYFGCFVDMAGIFCLFVHMFVILNYF